MSSAKHSLNIYFYIQLIIIPIIRLLQIQNNNTFLTVFEPTPMSFFKAVMYSLFAKCVFEIFTIHFNTYLTLFSIQPL